MEHQSIEKTLQTWFPRPAFVKCARNATFPLLPKENKYIANAALQRRQEYSTGRHFARMGLESFGLYDMPITTGILLDPVWPNSIMGSISHDGDLCSIVVCSKLDSKIKSLGIDLVEISLKNKIIDDLTSLFISENDNLNIVEKFGFNINNYLLLFSLKEAGIKAASSYIGEFIDIRQVVFTGDNYNSLIIQNNEFRVETFAYRTENYLITAVII